METYQSVLLENGETKLLKQNQRVSNPKNFLLSDGGKFPYMLTAQTDNALIKAGKQPLSNFSDIKKLFVEMFNTIYKTNIEVLLVETKTQFQELTQKVEIQKMEIPQMAKTDTTAYSVGALNFCKKYKPSGTADLYVKLCNAVDKNGKKVDFSEKEKQEILIAAEKEYFKTAKPTTETTESKLSSLF